MCTAAIHSPPLPGKVTRPPLGSAWSSATGFLTAGTGFLPSGIGSRNWRKPGGGTVSALRHPTAQLMLTLTVRPRPSPVSLPRRRTMTRWPSSFRGAGAAQMAAPYHRHLLVCGPPDTTTPTLLHRLRLCGVASRQRSACEHCGGGTSGGSCDSSSSNSKRLGKKGT
eukprot:SAG25_NODE_22_length_22323_cov_52.926874_11_plen_167_part_00